MDAGSAPGLSLLDLNDDGLTDIVAATGGDGTLNVHLNSGRGEFTKGVPYPVPAATALAVGDLDGANGPDVVALSSGEDVARVFMNKGGGTLSPESTRYAGGRLLFGLSLAPLQSGALDLILASAGDDRLDILATENGTRWSRPLKVQPPELVTPVSVTAADVNRDGRPDLIVPSHNSDRVLILQNEGGYQFKTRSVAVGRHPIAVAALELTGDGLLDLAVLNAADNTLQVLVNRGEEGFAASVKNTLGTGAQPVALASGDINGDGKEDLVVVHREAGLVKFLYAR